MELLFCFHLYFSYRNTTKKYNIMAFNTGDRVNCSSWTQVSFHISVIESFKKKSRNQNIRMMRNYNIPPMWVCNVMLPFLFLPRHVWKETWVLGEYMGRRRHRRVVQVASLAKNSERKLGEKSLELLPESSKWRISHGSWRSMAKLARG